MNRIPGKLIAVVLMAGLLGLPAGLSAKQRRGATLVVTQLDGALVSGELIAVRPDSLLLLSDSRDLSIPMAEVQIVSAKPKKGAVLVITRLDSGLVKGELIAVRPDSLLLLRGGADVSIPRAKIQSVQILRRSKKGTGTFIGFLGGALVGIGWGVSYGDSGSHGIRTPIKAGLFAGGLGALIGFLVSPGGGVDSTLVFAGSSSLAAAENWVALRAYSREARRAKAVRRR